MQMELAEAPARRPRTGSFEDRPRGLGRLAGR